MRSGPSALLRLQSQAGNRAATRLLASGPRTERSPRDAGPVVVQRGEAHVHEGIEKLAAAGSPEQFVTEMYAGNWMRDFSQLNLPMAHSIAARLPRDLGKSAGEPVGPGIGATGAEDIVTAVIRALAHLHFGPDLTDELVTPDNIGRYTPEQHVDNPMGTTAEHHLVRDSASGELRTGVPEMSTVRDATGPIATESRADPDRDAQLAGKAFPGLQTENPKLFEISDAGLTNHVYNGAEWAKNQLSLAAEEGATPRGRMFLGSALHAVEDYYAHSNFIEVALNSEIGRAMKAAESGAQSSLSHGFLGSARENMTAGGLYVDTVYGTGKDVARSRSGRLAVTTGTAGSEDLRVSIGQILLPKLPELAEKISTSIDRALGLVADSKGKSSWEKIEEKLKTERGGAATLELLGALDRNVTVPIWDVDLSKRFIPFTNRFIPTGLDTSQRRGGVVEGIRHYIALYRRWDHYFSQLDPFSFIVDLSEQFHALVRGYIDDLKAQLRQAIMEYLVTLAEEITGIELRHEKDTRIEQALARAGSVGVEHIRGGTSIESQLPGVLADPGLDPESAYAMYGVRDGKPESPLPPSHSEISKDHPPHEGHVPHGPDPGAAHAGDAEHDIEEGSIFYGLHEALAVEADAHVINKMREVWDEQVQANRVSSLRSTPRLDAAEITEEASRRQQEEQARAAAEGRRSDAGDLTGSLHTELLAMVDLFIAHPDDSAWWRPILSSYVDAHEAEVIRHIRARNQTRSRRT